MKSKISITLRSSLVQEIDQMIDNLTIRNRSQAIEHLVGRAIAANKHAVILAGGPEEKLALGKSFRMTAKIGSVSLVQHQLRKLRLSGFRSISIIERKHVLTGIFEEVKDGSEFGVEIKYVEEKAASGTADSLRLLQGKVPSQFLVVYGDILFDAINLQALWEEHANSRGIVTVLLTTSSKPSDKGVVVMEGRKILEFQQKPHAASTYLVFSPIFVCSEEIFEYQGSSLEQHVFPRIAKNGLLVGHVSSQEEVHINSLSDLKKMR